MGLLARARAGKRFGAGSPCCLLLALALLLLPVMISPLQLLAVVLVLRAAGGGIGAACASASPRRLLFLPPLHQGHGREARVKPPPPQPPRPASAPFRCPCRPLPSPRVLSPAYVPPLPSICRHDARLKEQDNNGRRHTHSVTVTWLPNVRGCFTFLWVCACRGDGGGREWCGRREAKRRSRFEEDGGQVASLVLYLPNPPHDTPYRTQGDKRQAH